MSANVKIVVTFFHRHARRFSEFCTVLMTETRMVTLQHTPTEAMFYSLNTESSTSDNPVPRLGAGYAPT